MKTLLLNLVIICFFVSCSAQQDKQNRDVVGYEKYNEKTEVLVDNLNREVMPEVLGQFYYRQLEENDFHKIQSVIKEGDGKRTVNIKSKQANDGYLYVTKCVNEFIDKGDSVVFIVGQDTVNTKERVMNLVKMKQDDLVGVDTLIIGNYKLIKIN